MGTAAASFKIMTSKQADNLQPMNSQQLNLVSQNPDDAQAVLNQIFQDLTAKSDRRWYATPETCDDPSKLNKIEKRICNKIIKLRAEEKLDPTTSEEQRQELLANFQWEQSILSEHEKQTIEALLIKYHDNLCQTQTEHRDQHRVQDKVESQTRRTCLCSKLAHSYESER